MTPIPAFKDINPALINEMTRTDIRELEFNMAVEKIPMLILLKRLSVDLLRIFRSGPSVNILNPFSRLRIPNNNMVTPTPISIMEGYIKSIMASTIQNVRKNICCLLNSTDINYVKKMASMFCTRFIKQFNTINI
jgi:hypothetical protein